jgi:6-phosphogluconate dehydrogenase
MTKESHSMSVPQIVPGKTKLGWIGTGVMGKSMVGHLMDKGFSATVYNRSKDKAEPPSKATSSSRSSASRQTCGTSSSALTAPWPAARRGTSSST